MEIISTIILIAGLLVFIVALVGIFYPALFETSQEPGGRISRIDCAILASVGPLPFLFVADWFRTADKPEGLFAFLMASALIIGPFAFYFWGLNGVRNFLYYRKGFPIIFAVLGGLVLAVIPVVGFAGIFFSMIATNTPRATWIGQAVAFIVGVFILVRFTDAFKLPFLDSFSSDAEPVSEAGEQQHADQDDEEDMEDSDSWLFSFTYTDDDGLPSRVEAWISTAEFDDQGRRYIQGICAKTSTPRFFWLGRILGPMTGPAEEDSDGEERDASEVFEQLLAFQAEEAQA